MALTSFSGSSQVALSPRHTAAAEDVLSVALARSDASLDDETQRTVSVFGRYRREIQERLSAQAAEIRQLRELLVAANARPRELTIAHEERTRADQERIAILERRAVAAEQERDAATRLGTEAETARAQEATRAAELQQEAVAARAETATVRTESAQQMATALAERNAALAAERQRGDALVAAERQTADEMRVRQEKLTKLLQIEAEDTRAMERLLGRWTAGLLFAIPKTASLMEKLQALIKERSIRSANSVFDATIQNADTDQLQALAEGMKPHGRYVSHYSVAIHYSFIYTPNGKNYYCENPTEEILLPLIAARRVRIR